MKKLIKILYHHGLPFVPKTIWTKLIGRHHNNPLVGYFGIEKICEFLAQKYYWPTLRHNMKIYVKGYDVCLASKAVCYKPYGNFQLLPVPTHRWKDLSMDFVTGLPVSIDWKGDSYNSILVIVNQLTKMVHYKLVKITVNASGLVEIIIDVVVRHHRFLDLIVTNKGFLFNSNFWSLLCYFFGIKRRLFTAFYHQTDSKTERENDTMEAYFRAFVNFE